MNDEGIGIILATIIMSTIILAQPSCTPPREPPCPHWTVPDDQKVNASTHMTNILKVGYRSSKTKKIREAEQMALRLFGSCPINCSYDSYLIQASREVDAELVKK